MMDASTLTKQSFKKLEGIQALRCIAALSVLFQHSLYLSGLALHAQPNIFLQLKLGEFGVLLFFFISGFIMMFQINKTSSEFILHRFFRIYPPYFCALILAVLILTPTFGIHHFDFNFHWDLLLLPSGHANASFGVPYWTLIYEVFFYGIISLVLLTKNREKTLTILLLIWAIIITSLTRFDPLTKIASPNILQIGVSYCCMFFIVGAAFGLLYLKKSNVFFWIVAILGIFFIFTPSSLYPFNSMIYHLLICIGLFYVFLNFYHISNNKLLNIVKRMMVRFGDYSYGLYLIHLPIVTAICYSSYFMALGRWKLFLVAIVVAGTFGLIYGYIEHRVYVLKLRPLANSLVGVFQKEKLAAAKIMPISKS